MARTFHNRHYHELVCWACKRHFTAWLGNAKFCSAACRHFAFRMERAGKPWHFLFSHEKPPLDLHFPPPFDDDQGERNTSA